MSKSPETGLPPGPLYKYLSLSPGQSPSWEERLDQLMNGRCFFPSASDFNDPFDCLPYIETPGTTEEIRARQAPLISRMAEAIRPVAPTNLPEVPAEYLEQRIAEALARFSPEKLNEGAQIGVRMNAKQMGVFCLAETIDSVLMWSHYGSNHSGIALQFDFRRQPFGGLMPLRKVQYQPGRPTVPLFIDSWAEETLPVAFATKAQFWNYEQEWRSMKPDGAHQTFKFNPEVVTGVVFGANCHSTDEERIRAMARGRGWQFYRVQPNERTFDLSLASIS